MFKSAIKIRTVIGLAAASLVISYFIIDKLIEKGVISTTTEIGMLLFFFILLIPILLLIALLSKENNAPPIEPTSGVEQLAVGSGSVSQSVVRKGKEGVLNVKQTSTDSIDIKQKVEES